METAIRARRLLGFVVLAPLAALCLLLTGCASTDDADNVSERPWNAPRNWEGGLPAGMMEGR
jgi:hypothetical protein